MKDNTRRTKILEARIKLTSDFINRMGVNFVTFGFVTSAALLLDQVAASPWLVLGVSLTFIVVGLALYWWARLVLGRLE